MGHVYRRKISSRGQIVLPPEVRRDLGLRAGDEVVFEKVDGTWVIKPGLPPRKPFLEAIGALRHQNRTGLSTTELLDELRGPWSGTRCGRPWTPVHWVHCSRASLPRSELLRPFFNSGAKGIFMFVRRFLESLWCNIADKLC